MFQLHQFPKSIKKTIRYILQDADEQKLREIEQTLSKAIATRRKELSHNNCRQGEWTMDD